MKLGRNFMVSPSTPEPDAQDAEDVRWALVTAKRLASTGEAEAAVRWVRRAVSAALEQQQMERATQLDRAAQLLENALGSQDAEVPSTERGDGTVVDLPNTPPARALAPTLQDIAVDPTTVASPSRPRGGFDVDDETTVVSTPDDLALGVALGNEATLRMRAPPPGPTPSSPSSTDVEPTVVSRPAVRDTLEELHIPPSLRDEAAAAASDTLTSFSRFRVALLASSDDEHPRVIHLGADESPPPGSGLGYIIADSEEDRLAIASLLGVERDASD